MRLETRALHWLLYKGGCHYAVCERSPRPITGEPDVLGVKAGRRMVEIEIKRSVSDFRANAKKRHVVNRDIYIDRWPYQFYFLVPLALKNKVLPILPSWAGLMTDESFYVQIEKVAPINKLSKRLTVKECLRLARNLANHSASVEQRFDNVFQQWKEGRWWPECEYHI